MIHNIKYRLFVYENEDEEKLIEGLNFIFPDEIPEREEAEGIFGEADEIIIYSGIVSKKRHTKEFLNNLFENLTRDDIDKLYDELDKKTDDQCNLFLRLSKEAILDEKWQIVDGGDSIHLKIKIAAFPAKKEIALENMKEFIENKSNNNGY
ncbi:RNA-binding protein [uncultured Methanobrevibacter sp.]|uniref:RNA-binding protein n=1 Tax=uncultured Methanobrevibacter sp. TaxID=253161 RepID=UPI0025EE7084|nr:RNA-binding protein [uncultured Methanobrevibacter sp.]